MTVRGEYLTTSDVLEALRDSGKPLHEWGLAVDGTPLLAARTGGERKPAIFITAGSHAPEAAGVYAALELLRALETEHETHVLPLRDPLGFDGVNRCLSFAARRPVQVSSHRAALDYLSANGRLLLRDGEARIFLLGGMGFMWDLPTPGVENAMFMNAHLRALLRDAPVPLEPLRGARLMVLCDLTDVDGAGEMQRCFHLVIGAEGELMHLNRYFGRNDAPSEVAAVDRLMQAVRPGLTCDLHEGNGRGFWMPMARPRTNPERVFEMTKSFFEQITRRGYPIATYDNVIATDPNLGTQHVSTRSAPEPRLPGMLWSNSLLRNEGHNLGTYAGLFGIGFGTEAAMERPLAERVDGITHGILAAIRVWEETL
jgi:hypothetical protein